MGMDQVLVHFAPAHELVTSLDAFLYTANKGMDLGDDWVKSVRDRLGDGVADSLRWATASDPFALAVLAWQCPGTPSPQAFIDWLASLSPGQLYERMVPYVPRQKMEILHDLGQWQRHVMQLLTTWDRGYFCTLDPAVLHILAAEAERLRGQVGTRAATLLIEQATTGVVMESDEVDQVLLIPQTHFRPLNRYAKCNRLLVCQYPVEADTAEHGQPGVDLMRTVRALADENRLKIMHFLAAGEPRSFAEVMRHLCLAKNTVYYHMLALRTAGLVRLHLTGECDTLLYTARRAALDEIGPRLHRFLDDR